MAEQHYRRSGLALVEALMDDATWLKMRSEDK